MNLTRSHRLKLRDVLVLTLSNVTPEEEPALTELAANLSNVCRIPIIVLQDGMTIDSISEQDMVAAGWVRMERRSDARNGHQAPVAVVE